MMEGVALGAVDLGLIAAYFVGSIALGIWFGRRHETAEDFFLAGRGMLWPVIGISLFASNISSSTLVGLAGDAYATGISVYNYEWMAAVVLVVFAIFFLPFLLRARVYTMPEFLARRFSGSARTYFALLTLFLNIVVDTAGGLYAGALMLGMIFPGIDLWVVVAVLAVAAGIYTAFGGLAAVMYTDVIQAALLILGSVLISLFAYQAIGGWDAVVAAVPAEKLSLIRPPGDPGVPWPGLLSGVFLLGFYFWCTNQFMVQRVLSARSLDHGRWGVLFAGLLKLPVLFIMVLPGSFALLLYPGLERPDLVYPTLLFDLLPVGVLGLVIAGFIAALMSQIDAQLRLDAGDDGFRAPLEARSRPPSPDARGPGDDGSGHAARRAVGAADRALRVAVQISPGGARLQRTADRRHVHHGRPVAARQRPRRACGAHLRHARRARLLPPQ